MTNTTITVTCDMCGSLISKDGQLVDLNADRFKVIKKSFILNRERKIDLCSRCIETIMNAKKKGGEGNGGR